MLHLKKVLNAKPKEHEVVTLKTLYTPWGEAFDFDHVLEDHPDPQFARASFVNLNGPWQCAFVSDGHGPTDNLEQVVCSAPMPAREAFEQDIVVPFSPEAPLSQVCRQLQPDELLWYRRSFCAPDLPENGRCLLHFQAVDYACAVHVNGSLVGSHVGGYLPFSFDITDALADGENELAVCVADPSEFGGRLRGKQRFDRGDIWYTAQSGIWQAVWLEAVPANYVRSLHIEPDAHDGVVVVGARVVRNAARTASAFTVEVTDADGAVLAKEQANVSDGTCAIALRIEEPHLWCPQDPFLYQLKVGLDDDVVASYFAFRSVEAKLDDEGRRRVFLNGKPLFIKGVLDQAYWPDGLMTAPTDEALVFDIEEMFKAGFNLMRKHIKVESARWYYHCDKMGMLVLQDMVSGGAAELSTWHYSYKPTLFKPSWTRYRDDTPAHQANLGAADVAYQAEWSDHCRQTIEALSNHPCIIGWSLFNEGWGQFNAKEAYRLARKTDPTRVIDATSGWYDQGCGDFSSVHNYFRDLTVWPDRKHGRAFFISEFGGLTHRVDGHSSLDDAYGYEIYEDLSEWRKAVRAMLAEVNALEGKGLAGYVYTQVSDIEEEANGILTYDRRVNKLG